MENLIKNRFKNYTGKTPGISNALSHGWDMMTKNFLTFFLIVFALAIVDAPVQWTQETINDSHGWGNWGWGHVSPLVGFFIFLYWLLFLPIIEYGADLLFLQGARGEKIEVKNLVIGFKNYINIVLVNLLMFGLIGISFFLLIIPGIIVSVRLAFVSYLVMDENLSPIEAVETSWRITRGHGLKIFGLAITAFFVFILGLLCLIVGVIPAIMWIKSAFAALYLSITGEQNNETEQAPSTEPPVNDEAIKDGASGEEESPEGGELDETKNE